MGVGVVAEGGRVRPAWFLLWGGSIRVSLLVLILRKSQSYCTDIEELNIEEESWPLFSYNHPQCHFSQMKSQAQNTDS